MPFEDLFPVLKPEQFLFLWDIVKNWIWVPLAILFFSLAINLYLFLIRQRFKARIKWYMLEIKIPREIFKPIKAMESVFAAFWASYRPPNFREKWLDGRIIVPFSLEMVGIGSEPHFFIQVAEEFRHLVETAIYSQYADVEISEVDDYTKYVPKNIPNKDWDLWGTDMILLKEDPYPIKTYPFFEVEREVKEERIVDPLSSLLEGMTRLRPREQLWVQINATPITNLESPWVSRGEMIRDRLAKRAPKTVPKSLIHEAAEVLISGPSPPSAEERDIFPPELRLTPGERDTITGVENKIAKYGFETNIRFIYLAPRDLYFPPIIVRSAFGFFTSFSTQNLNGFRPWGRTITKIRTIFWFLDRRRVYIRKRKILRNYIRRFPPLYPRKGGTFVLNTEELASLYHFPSKIAAPSPTLPRIEAKKREAPPGLPSE